MRSEPNRLRSIGQNIERLREKKGWTKLQLAAKASVDDSQLSKIERGLRGTSLEGYELIAKALGVPLPRLLTARPPRASRAA